MEINIMTIGSEIITGDIVDLNSKYLCEQLNGMGHSINSVVSIGDGFEVINDTVQFLLKSCDILFVTGGLGPTVDDITVEAIAKTLNRELVFDNDILEMIKARFKTIGREMTDNNKKQAYKIEDSTVIENHFGTAAGSRVDFNDKVIYILPGPPYELQKMFGQIKSDFIIDNNISSRLFRCVGIGESSLETKVKDIIISDEIEYGIYASSQYVDIKVTTYTGDNKILDKFEKLILERIGEHVYSNDLSIEETIVNILLKKQLTMSIAESCTGGMLASKFVSIPGVSPVFKEAVVTYSNESKITRLGVNPALIDEFGAVSSEVSKEMAEGVCSNLNTNIGIAITGEAGVSLDGKKTGLVYIAISYNGKCEVKELNLRGERDVIRNRACLSLLEMLYHTVK